MDNIFIRYIEQGKIRGLGELKRAYRQIMMKTHPDAVGSDRLVEKYIECRNWYEETRAILEDAANRHDLTDYRLLFYREFYRLERIDKPYAFNKYYFSRKQIQSSKQRALELFGSWQKERIGLYVEANRIYDRIKLEKPRGPYRKHALLFNLSPALVEFIKFLIADMEHGPAIHVSN